MFLGYKDISSHGIDTVRLEQHRDLTERCVFLVLARAALLKGAYLGRGGQKTGKQQGQESVMHICFLIFSRAQMPLWINLRD